LIYGAENTSEEQNYAKLIKTVSKQEKRKGGKKFTVRIVVGLKIIHHMDGLQKLPVPKPSKNVDARNV